MLVNCQLSNHDIYLARNWLSEGALTEPGNSGSEEALGQDSGMPVPTQSVASVAEWLTCLCCQSFPPTVCDVSHLYGSQLVFSIMRAGEHSRTRSYWSLPLLIKKGLEQALRLQFMKPANSTTLPVKTVVLSQQTLCGSKYIQKVTNLIPRA